MWSNGFAEDRVAQGGVGAHITTRTGEVMEVKVAAGQLSSSTRAELFALRAALQRVDQDEDAEHSPVVVCCDSKAAPTMLNQKAAAQTTILEAAIWDPASAPVSR